MKIAFGVDPGGFELREGVLAHLKEKGHDVVDLGTQNMENAVPYMLVGRNVAQEVTGGKAEFGIVMCGTGMGISIATNKNKGARCAMVESCTLRAKAASSTMPTSLRWAEAPPPCIWPAK